MDEYYRVSPIQMSEGSDLDSQGQPYFKQSRRKSGSDFGNIFISACDELKQRQASHTKVGVIPLAWRLRDKQVSEIRPFQRQEKGPEEVAASFGSAIFLDIHCVLC